MVEWRHENLGYVEHIMKKRSGPIYLRSGGKVISLVEEIKAREIRLPILRARLQQFVPSALYVIDEKGVERIGFKNTGVWGHLVMRPGRLTTYHANSANKERQSPQGAWVFGKPRAVGNKTLIPVRSVLHISEPGSLTGSSAVPTTSARRIAMIEVSGGKVRVQPTPGSIPVGVIVILAAYNVYWLAKAVHKRRGRR
jgi:hypothetical protein